MEILMKIAVCMLLVTASQGLKCKDVECKAKKSHKNLFCFLNPAKNFRPTFYLNGILSDLDCFSSPCRMMCSPCPKPNVGCPNHKHTAQCRVDTCNQCQHVWFDKEGMKLDKKQCGSNKLPPISDEPTPTPADNKLCNRKCPADACPTGWSGCPAKRDAICKPNPCDNCRPVWYDTNGEELTDLECFLSPCRRMCPSDSCPKDGCPGHYGATCRVDTCNDCKAVYFDEEGKRLTDLQCFEPLCDRYCPADSCPSTGCAAHPGATCVADTCNDCKPVFFDKEGQRLTDLQCFAPLCKVYCQYDFCDWDLCPKTPGSICKMDTCNHCMPVYFHPNTERRLSYRDCETFNW